MGTVERGGAHLSRRQDIALEGFITTALQEFAKQGILGLLLIGTIYAWYKRDQELIKLHVARAEDGKEMTKVMVEAIVVMRAITAGQEKAAAASSAQAETTRIAMTVIERVLDRLDREK